MLIRWFKGLGESIKTLSFYSLFQLNYASNAATPGSTFPSMYSRSAPPPVDT